MAIADLDDLVFLPRPGEFTSNSQLLLDASGEKAAFVFRAPRTGTIDRVCFRTQTVTTGDTLDVRLETVDAATGDPTGTLWAANTNASQVVANADDNVWFEVTLTAGAVVTRGDRIAFVIVNGAAGALNIVQQIANSMLERLPMRPMNYALHFASSWAKQNSGMVGAVRYSDGSYAHVPNLEPLANTAATVFNSGSSPDERGNRFILPFKARCVGLWAGLAKTAGATVDLKLYDSGSTLLESVNLDLDVMEGSGGNAWGLFDSSVTLDAGSLYRMTIAPDTATSVTDREQIMQSAALMNAAHGGDAMYLTTRTDGGAWTDTATQRVSMGLILDGLDDGAGGGSSGGGAARRFWGRGGQH